jgi:hypothetical protein
MFRIEVEDSGPGIEPDNIPRLFADFQQLDSARSGVGTGLGLALTKRIVEEQGGTVGVRSELGAGSVFFAVLPIAPRGDRFPDPGCESVAFGGVAEAKTKIAVFPAPMRGRPRSLQEVLHL